VVFTSACLKETLEAVYYSAQVPSSSASLTMLAFLFDRIHFPGVYMPNHARLDLNGLQKEIERIGAYDLRDGLPILEGVFTA